MDGRRHAIPTVPLTHKAGTHRPAEHALSVELPVVMFVAVVIVWALVLGVSPGLALTAIPLAALALDRYDSTILDRLSSRVAE